MNAESLLTKRPPVEREMLACDTWTKAGPFLRGYNLLTQAYQSR